MTIKENFQKKYAELTPLSEEFVKNFGQAPQALHSASSLLSSNTDSTVETEAFRNDLDSLISQLELLEFQMNATFSYIAEDVNTWIEAIPNVSLDAMTDTDITSQDTPMFNLLVGILEFTSNLEVLASQVDFLQENFDDEDNRLFSSSLRRKVSKLQILNKSEKEEVTSSIRLQRQRYHRYLEMLYQINNWLIEVDALTKQSYAEMDEVRGVEE